jgi:branched-chain amino acid transport system substrate-binding protein
VKKRLLLIPLSLLLAISLVAIGCPSPEETTTPPPTETTAPPGPVVEEWHIPTLYFLSGPMAGDCEPQKWLTDKVVEEINAAGGIAGKPIVLEYCDSAFDPAKATACMAKAIDAGALCVNGPLSDVETKAVMPLASKEGIFCFAGTATEDVAKEFCPWTLDTTGKVGDTIKYQMEMWYNNEPDIESVVAIEQPIYQMLRTLNEGFLATLDSIGVETFPIIEAPSDMADYDPIVVKALGTGANAFIIAATGEVAAKLVKGLVSGGADPTNIYIQSGFVGPAFLEGAEGYDEGVYSGTSPTYAPNPEYERLSEAYKETHGGMAWGGLTYRAYDILYMIKAAFENQGITGDPAKLEEERIKIRDYAINQNDFKGLLATYDVVNCLAEGWPQRIFQIHNNEAVLAEEVIP